MNQPLELRDIHLPVEPGWWPLAPGWWLLLFVVSVLLMALIFWLVRRNKSARQRYARADIVKAARHELATINTQYAQDADAWLKALSVLLRRSAISLHGRQSVSGLTGEEWLAFLEAKAGKSLFPEPFAHMLTEQPYRAQGSENVAALSERIERWLLAQERGHV